MVNFSKVSLVGANLTGANLTGTDFTDARFSTGTKWLEGFDPLTIGAHGPGVDYSDSEFSVSAYQSDRSELHPGPDWWPPRLCGSQAD